MGRRQRRAGPGLLGVSACSPASASSSRMRLTSAAVLALLAATLQEYREFSSVFAFVRARFRLV